MAAFSHLSAVPVDPILALTARYRADPRTQKMDLGVGVYRDADGNGPVFAAVKRAERRLADTQATKAYRGSDGDPEFVSRLGDAALHPAIREGLAGLQTVGGTGALRLAAELLAKSQPGRRVWMSLPSWANHVPLFTAAGLKTVTVTVDSFKTAMPTDHSNALLDALQGAAPGDAVLLHACCHNPTGVDPHSGFWEQISEQVLSRGLVPLIDMAYQGLGSGWEADAAGVRLLAQRVPDLLIAYSCDKNFGLYRDRVGALFLRGASLAQTTLMHDNVLALARASYAMPPDHGAAVVRIILEDAALTAEWRVELDRMRTRIHTLRTALAAHGAVDNIDLAPLATGRGLFALLPLDPAQIDWLRSHYGIYMAPSGRINIAGLAERHIERLVEALHAVQYQRAA